MGCNVGPISASGGFSRWNLGGTVGSNSEVAAPLQRLKLITAMFDDEVVCSTVYKNAMEEVKNCNVQVHNYEAYTLTVKEPEPPEIVTKYGFWVPTKSNLFE